MFAELQRTDGRWCLINPQAVDRVEQVQEKPKVAALDKMRPRCLLMQNVHPDEIWIEVYGTLREIRALLCKAMQQRFETDERDIQLINDVVSQRMRALGSVVPDLPTETAKPSEAGG